MANWQHTDITAATEAPSAAAGSSLTSYIFDGSGNHSQHVFYRGDNGHVHELQKYTQVGTWLGEWQLGADITAATGAPPATAGCNLTGYNFKNQQPCWYVFYRGDHGHVHNIFWVDTPHGEDIRHTDLTEATKAPPATIGSNLTSYIFEDQHTQHVFYCGGDDHVHELEGSGGMEAWHHTNLTALFQGAPSATAGSNLTGYTFKNQHTKHVFYRGDDGYVHELWWDGIGGWHLADLTKVMGAPLPLQAVI